MYALEQLVQALNPFYVAHTVTINLVVGFIASLSLFRVVTSAPVTETLALSKPGWLGLTLVFYSLISTLWSPDPSLSLTVWMSSFPYVVLSLIIAPILLKNVSRFDAVFGLFIVFGVLICVALLLGVSWDQRNVLITTEEGRGMWGNPLAVASLAGTVSLVALLYRPSYAGAAYRLMRWSAAAVAIILIVKSGSRGQLMFVFVSLLLVSPFLVRQSMWKGIAAVLLVAAIMLAAAAWSLEAFWQGSDRWSADNMDSSAEGRLDNALFLVSLAASEPGTLIFGLGNSAAYDRHLLGIYPHFVPLEVLAEEGLVGFGIYTLLIAATFASLMRCWKLAPLVPVTDSLVVTLGAVFVFNWLLSWKQGSMLGNVGVLMLGSMIGELERTLNGMLLTRYSPPAQRLMWTRTSLHKHARSSMK
jgi:hypothetical protein